MSRQRNSNTTLHHQSSVCNMLKSYWIFIENMLLLLMLPDGMLGMHVGILRVVHQGGGTLINGIHGPHWHTASLTSMGFSSETSSLSFDIHRLNIHTHTMVSFGGRIPRESHWFPPFQANADCNPLDFPIISTTSVI